MLKEPARCVVEAGGLGYALHISLSTYEELPAHGEALHLLLHPVIREDEWRLFGFAQPQERDVFRDLLRVNGIGPLMALGLLSGFQPAELATVVSQGDVRALTRVKGIGKKTAERILVELKHRWKDGALPESPISVGAPEAPGADAVRALEALGLDGGEAGKRVRKVLDDTPEAELAEIVRRALRA